MLREVGTTFEHRQLHFLDEHAAAADLVDRDVGTLVAARLDDQQLDVAAEQLRHALRLPQRQRAPARVAHGRTRSFVVVGGRLRQIEQLGERVGVELSPSRAGGVLHADRGLVQQLVDDALGDRLDDVARRGLE